MIKLYLNNTEVFPTTKQSITVSKENPYFTLSESYSLDVEIPLDIPDNFKFFGNVNRMDVSKNYRTFDALMVSSVGVLIKGSARITKSSDSVVNLQITMGVSAVKMIADKGDLYIDEMNLGYCPEATWSGFFRNTLEEGVRHDMGTIASGGNEPPLESYGIPFYDMTNGVVVNVGKCLAGLLLDDIDYYQDYVSMCPKLLDIARNVLLQLGFVLDMSLLPEAAHHLYIVTGIHADYAAMKLPHWKVSRFMEELQNFFACVIVGDGDHKLKMVSLKDYAHNDITEIEPSATFEVNYTGTNDVKGIINNNVSFAINGGDIEVVADDIMDAADAVEMHKSYADALWSYKDNANRNLAKRTIYNVDGELYCGWEHDDESVELKRIAPFNPLKRYEDGKTVELSICPAVMMEDFVHKVTFGSKETEVTLNIIAVENHLPIRNRSLWNNEENMSPTLQQLIEGEESIMEPEDKGDIMPVAFLGEGRKKVTLERGAGKGPIDTTIALAFTDNKFKKEPGFSREPWSLSLQDLPGFEFCLGSLHKLPYNINRNVKHCFKFLSKSVPDPTNIFYCRGKKYACEKIDISTVDGEVSQLMTGYFYELIE